MSSAHRPPTAQRLRLAREWQSTRDPASWPQAPPGDFRPAMLIPGLLAGDTSLSRMARWLKTGGFVLTRSGIVWNTGCLEPTVASVERRLERAVERAGRPALLVGQSRGGSIGRAVAVRRPELVETLVTLGSPMLDQLAVSRRVRATIGALGLLGTLHVPGLFSMGCLDGDCCARAREEVTGPFPEEVGFVSVYSRTDEVVRWEACLDPAAAHVEVQGSHVGMALSAHVWRELSNLLTPSSITDLHA